MTQPTLEAELTRARKLSASELADAIESIGFECTRCGACCRGDDDEHTATIFPEEVRTMSEATNRDWRDVARPMPYGLTGGEGETFEWALQTDNCGDCQFYTEADGIGACSAHADRPLICQTYPFSVDLGGTSQPMGEAVDKAGIVRAHECEGLGRDISRADAEAMAETLKERAVRELEEAIGVRENYRSVDRETGEIIVHDSEGQKRADGSVVEK